jgi:hypothetical protein
MSAKEALLGGDVSLRGCTPMALQRNSRKWQDGESRGLPILTIVTKNRVSLQSLPPSATQRNETTAKVTGRKSGQYTQEPLTQWLAEFATGDSGRSRLAKKFETKNRIRCLGGGAAAITPFQSSRVYWYFGTVAIQRPSFISNEP